MNLNDKKTRELLRMALWYQEEMSGGLAGQAFTGYTCLKCDKEQQHPNTNTPVFCRECTKELKEVLKK